jgi:hypothetical protein
LIIVAVRYFGRVIGVTKVYPVGMLRYFVVLGSLSVIMGLALVPSEAPEKPPEDTSELLNSQTEKWQAVKDAKGFLREGGQRSASAKARSRQLQRHIYLPMRFRSQSARALRAMP